MKQKIEKASFTNNFRLIKKDIDRLYFGNEFCENLIPSLSELKKTYFYVKEKNINFTLVTPFVTNSGLKKIEPLLSFLDKQKDSEVVFNDWGVFSLMKNKFNNLKLVLGRLLTKQRRDPRIIKILLNKQVRREIFSPDKKNKLIILPKKTPKSLFVHFQSSLINADIFQRFILAQGISRVEVDNLIWEMNLKINKNIGISIYLPFGYITTTRKCAKLTFAYDGCKKECKNFYFEFKKKNIPVPLYSIGNTIFYRSKFPNIKYLRILGIDRIVFQPNLPF